MDILKARKKAAERPRKKVKPAPTPDARPVQEEPAPPAETGPAPSATAAEAPARESGVEAVEELKAEMSPPDEPAEVKAYEIDLLSFRLGGEAYTVHVKDVREVLKIRRLTPVPNAPSYILGVTSLRGRMLPVIDLGKRLGLPPAMRDEKSRIVVVNSDEEDVGLVVDRVTGVLRIMSDEIAPTPENIEQGAEFLRGITRKDDKLFILLDLEKVAGK